MTVPRSKRPVIALPYTWVADDATPGLLLRRSRRQLFIPNEELLDLASAIADHLQKQNR